MPLGMQVGLGQNDFVLDADPPSPLQKRDRPQFSAHVYSGQTAGGIKMALGMEMGLDPRLIVLDGTQPPCPKGRRAPAPNFPPISIVAKRLDASRCHLVWR